MSRSDAPPLSRLHRLRRCLSLLLPTALLVALAGQPVAAQSAGQVRTPTPQVSAQPGTGVQVDAGLARALRGGERRDFAIELRERADLSGAAAMDWATRGEFVVTRLRETAGRSQANLRRQLDRAGVDYQAHWIKNVVLVRGGDATALRLASAQPGIARVRDLPQARLVRPEPGTPGKKAKAGIADNIAWIGADQAWEQGTRGSGVTVGVIDSGARHTHELIRQQYRGWNGGGYEHDYNWFQPAGGSPEPTTPNPHGSHVTGTIVGDNHAADPAQRRRLGVAPGAQWIACEGFPFDGDPTYSLLACGEFMLAPTRTDGSEPRPDLRPQVVNNSWSEGNCNGETSDFYADVIDAWVASGIFPVFAAGNTTSCWPPREAGLSTVSSPASLAQVFAVGSTGNHDGSYADHSLWGPTTAVSPGLPTLPDPRGFPQLKPQVVAPGVDIVSAFDGNYTDDEYIAMTGTSMSSPHITGLVALMLDAGGCLVGNYPALGTLIMQTARPVPYATGGDPAPGIGDVPNYATGWGEIDVPAAVDAASNACGPQGFIAGRVTDAGGNGVSGALVELQRTPADRLYTVKTDPDGSYIRRLPEDLSQGYTVRVSAYGYLPSSEAGVPVRDEATTPHDIRLATAPRYKVSGQVHDAATGWPLHARVRIAGAPLGTVWTDPGSGRYSVTLPQGTAYRFSVDSDIPGYIAQHRDIVDVAAASEQEFGLVADAVGCRAPGYAFTRQHASEDFETADGAPPGGWSATSAGTGWQFGTVGALTTLDWSMPPRIGRVAATIDAFPAEGEPANDGSVDFLTSPPITLTGTRPVVRYASYLTNWIGTSNPGGAQVLVSTDDGATWTTAGEPAEADGEHFVWTPEAHDLSPWAGQTVRLRFHYDDGSAIEPDITSPGWAIDDVSVVGDCAPPATGGLVTGHVRDANTDAGLDGALVQIGNAAPLTTTTSADPNIGTGYFVGYADGGSAQLQATRGSNPEGYGDAEASVAVVDGGSIGTTLALPAGRLRLHPVAGPSASVQLGTTASVPLSLRNTGTAPLRFGLEGVHLEEHFDAGLVPPAGWQVAGNGAGCGWTTNDATGPDSAAQVYLYPCFGGERVDTSLVLPPVDLSHSDTASIGFFLYLANHPAGTDQRFDIEASTDAGATWTSVFLRNNPDDAINHVDLVEHDLSAFAGTPDLRLRLRYQGTPPYGQAAIDQVHVFRGLGEDDPLAIVPGTGTLAPGASADANALFDATAIAQPGVYPVFFRVSEDTPYAFPFGDVQGTMTVTAPPTYGAVSGTLRSLGRCEAAPVALDGIDLAIVDAQGGEYVATTDADGHYRYWIDAARGPVTVTAEVDGHLVLQREAALAPGQDTPLDLDLRPTAPCLAADPATLDAALTAGGNISLPLDLVNLGPIAADYTARIGGDPSIPTAQRITQNFASDPEQYATFACFNPATEAAMENHWYRVFPLQERGIAGDTLLVDGVRFGADSATSNSGSQPVQIRLHALSGDFVLANLTLLGEVTVTVNDTPLKMLEAQFDAPISMPTDAVLVAEIAIADGSDGGNNFYPAGNTAGASAPAWSHAPGCGLTEPEPYSGPMAQFSTIIELDVRASDACGANATPVPWLAVAPTAGTVAGDATQALDVAVDAGTLAQGVHQGAVCIVGPTTQGDVGVVPVRLGVDAPLDDAIFTDGFE